MARPKTPQQSLYPIHVTARSNNRDWFSIPLSACCDIFVGNLIDSAEKYQLNIHSFVLMSNHFHLILSTPERNLGPAMKNFMSKTSRRIARKSDRINHIFGARYKWSILNNSKSLAYVYKYVYRNPVRAGLAQTVEGYPYSSICHLRLSETISLPLVENLDWSFLPFTQEARLSWLNAPSPKEEELIRLALKRSTFAFSRDKKVQLKIPKLEFSYLPPAQV
jgi:REP element-mobilizing transposase RayT